MNRRTWKNSRRSIPVPLEGDYAAARIKSNRIFDGGATCYSILLYIIRDDGWQLKWEAKTYNAAWAIVNHVDP
jgi:hypothetical protein